jgi:hypothetical protein
MQTLQSGIDMYHSELNLEKKFSESYVSLTTDFQNIRIQIHHMCILNKESWSQIGVSGAFLTRSNIHVLHSDLPHNIKYTNISLTLFLTLKSINIKNIVIDAN